MKKYQVIMGVLFLSFMTIRLNAQTIDRIKDGTYYEVQYTKYEYRPCSCCGYNDVAFPIDGKFEIEVRRYYTIKDGVEIKVWYKNVEIKWTGDCRG